MLETFFLTLLIYPQGSKTFINHCMYIQFKEYTDPDDFIPTSDKASVFGVYIFHCNHMHELEQLICFKFRTMELG